MIRRKLFFLAMALLSAFTAWGQTMSPTEALALAKQVWPASRDGKTVTPELAYQAKDADNDHPYYYIFNKGNDEGFVIISADSRSKSILAYSTTGHFDINTAPPEMKAWLGAYEEALSDLSLVPDSILKMNLRKERKRNMASRSLKIADSVAPLLGDIQYSQEYPYNAKCPWNSVTGCVATGAVQIMRYHEYPTQPSGKSHSYRYNGSTISTNYNTAYDWNNMLATYKNSAGNWRQIEAISQLMYDAGVSCDMSYTKQVSTAYTHQMAKSLSSYFGYDVDMTMYQRQYFSESEFVYYLKRELSAGRPVLFSGRGNSGGHCFVCDGYDRNGLFHFNWGWNGLSDGYYAISNLCPGQYSTGGGNGSYNQNVMFIGGIRPSENNILHNQLLGLTGNINGASSVSRGEQMTYTFEQVNNTSMRKFTGAVGVALYKNGSLSRILGKSNIVLNTGNYDNNITVSATFPTDLARGEYEIVFVCKDNSDSAWHPMLAYSCNSQKCSYDGRMAKMAWNESSRRIDLYFNDADIVPNKTQPSNPLDVRGLSSGSFFDKLFGSDDDEEEDEEESDDEGGDEEDENSLESAKSFYGV